MEMASSSMLVGFLLLKTPVIQVKHGFYLNCQLFHLSSFLQSTNTYCVFKVDFILNSKYMKINKTKLLPLGVSYFVGGNKHVTDECIAYDVSNKGRFNVIHSSTFTFLNIERRASQGNITAFFEAWVESHQVL